MPLAIPTGIDDLKRAANAITRKGEVHQAIRGKALTKGSSTISIRMSSFPSSSTRGGSSGIASTSGGPSLTRAIPQAAIFSISTRRRESSSCRCCSSPIPEHLT